MMSKVLWMPMVPMMLKLTVVFKMHAMAKVLVMCSKPKLVIAQTCSVTDAVSIDSIMAVFNTIYSRVAP